ncbi:ABC transporter substrate-binding protein [Actinophytocola xinjiangensis]|uniref:ABC transporter substrate-binding protein n=1 Tax=Actinophytocola xinjiangensis TaxID=485602 RepID=A0A7Z0WLJ7_9PSEU|nr:basic amino acid ABC transporter substrate-binding protein [Actinophytocola xinjiangensis]OLF09428.1 ABC transporter substrate-binding protein [Actinophytocola xinjiangensis]
MTRRPTLKVWAAVPALAIVLAGCGSDGGEAAGGVELVSDGKLTNCTGLPYKPFEYEEGGKVIGFDIDLVDLVAKELGVEQEVVDTPFDGIQSGADFNAGKCDISSAGMTITDARKKNIDFSDPYFDATQALVTKKGSGVSDLPDLAGKRLGVQNSTTGFDYGNEHATGAEIVNYEDLGLMLNAVETGQVDAAINDNGVLYDWVKDKTDFEVVKEFDTGEQYGMGVRKGNKELADTINKVLAEVKSSGEYDRIYEKWFGTAPSE